MSTAPHRKGIPLWIWILCAAGLVGGLEFLRAWHSRTSPDFESMPRGDTPEHLQGLAKLATHADPLIRYRAIANLRELRHRARPISATLENLLAHEDTNTRADALQALLAIQGAEALLPKLPELLDDPQLQMRELAMLFASTSGVVAMGEIETAARSERWQTRRVVAQLAQFYAVDSPTARQRALNLLRTLLFDDPHPRVRLQALTGLARTYTLTVEEVTRAFGDSDSLVVIHALHVAPRFQARAASMLPTLRQLLVRETPVVQQVTLALLERLGPEARVAIPEARQILQGRDLLAALNALRWLRTQNQDLNAALPRWRKLETMYVELFRVEMARASSNGPIALPDLARMGFDPMPADTRRERFFQSYLVLLRALGPFAEGHVGELQAAIADWPRQVGEVDLFGYAMDALGEIGAPAAPVVPRLFTLLEESAQQQYQPSRILLALARIQPNNAKVKNAVLKALTNETNSSLAPGYTALSYLQGPVEPRLQLLYQGLESSALPARLEIIRTLGVLGGPAEDERARTTVLAFFDEPSPEIRLAAIDAALAWNRGRAALIPRLRVLLTDSIRTLATPRRRNPLAREDSLDRYRDVETLKPLDAVSIIAEAIAAIDETEPPLAPKPIPKTIPFKNPTPVQGTTAK